VKNKNKAVAIVLLLAVAISVAWFVWQNWGSGDSIPFERVQQADATPAYEKNENEEKEHIPPTHEYEEETEEPYIPQPEPEVEPEPIRVATPASDLHLAMFAHMAFFPFHFNEGQSPVGRNFTPMHYRPFFDLVMTPDANGLNYYGFNFAAEMEDWQLQQVYLDRETGFKVVVFAAEGSTALAIRGTYGTLDTALTNQTGSWWYNIRSLTGETHSHIAPLAAFLNSQDIFELLQDTNIYITGHSLGGYLAYIAALQLVEMGLEDNIQRVAAFSAPIFDVQTIDRVRNLNPQLRSRIIHYYVPGDLISGAVGIPQDMPNYGLFTMVGLLFATLQDVRGAEIPAVFPPLVNMLTNLEGILPFALPDYVPELIWLLNGAMGAEAQALTNQFQTLIQHVQVQQTWHSPRADTPWAASASALDIIRNYTPELGMEIIADMIQGIFDADTHFMFNFYGHLAGL